MVSIRELRSMICEIQGEHGDIKFAVGEIIVVDGIALITSDPVEVAEIIAPDAVIEIADPEPEVTETVEVEEDEPTDSPGPTVDQWSNR